MQTKLRDHTQADMAFRAGRTDRAIKYYQACLDVYRVNGDVYGLAGCTHSLGVALVYENCPKEGMEALLQARIAWTGQNRINEVGRAERDIGVAHMLFRQYFEANEWLERSRQTLGFSKATERGLTEAKRGRLYSLDGEFDMVDGCFDEAFTLVAQAQSPEVVCVVHIDNAFACMERLQWGHMHNHLEAAWQIIHCLGDQLIRQMLQLTTLNARWLMNNSEWVHAQKLFREKFVEPSRDLSPGMVEVLKREVGADELAELLLVDF